MVISIGCLNHKGNDSEYLYAMQLTAGLKRKRTPGIVAL